MHAVKRSIHARHISKRFQATERSEQDIEIMAMHPLAWPCLVESTMNVRERSISHACRAKACISLSHTCLEEQLEGSTSLHTKIHNLLKAGKYMVAASNFEICVSQAPSSYALGDAMMS